MLWRVPGIALGTPPHLHPRHHHMKPTGAKKVYDFVKDLNFLKGFRPCGVRAGIIFRRSPTTCTAKLVFKYHLKASDGFNSLQNLNPTWILKEKKPAFNPSDALRWQVSHGLKANFSIGNGIIIGIQFFCKGVIPCDDPWRWPSLPPPAQLILKHLMGSIPYKILKILH